MTLLVKTKTYHGRSCRHGHGTLRYAAGRACIVCAKQHGYRLTAQKRIERQAEREASAPMRALLAKERQRWDSRRWAENNRELKNARSRKWNSENRFKRRAYKSQRRATKLNATPAWLTQEHKKEMIELYRESEQLGLTVDHIVPLQGKTVCGLHVPWNLQLLTLSDNSRKNNSLTV